jgi:hypothetical protein
MIDSIITELESFFTKETSSDIDMKDLENVNSILEKEIKKTEELIYILEFYECCPNLKEKTETGALLKELKEITVKNKKLIDTMDHLIQSLKS